MRRLGIFAVAVLLGVAAVPTVGADEPSFTATPIPREPLPWYDEAFHQRVLAAGTEGVRVPAGVPVPTAVGLAYPGIRPGQWLISVDTTGFAWCTANYVFKKRSTYGLGTAGHCAVKDALGHWPDVTAYVVPPPTSGKLPGIYHIGKFVLTRNGGVG